MLESVLVANRGEIACRIFRTARRLGLRTIAVYSDADAGALHVRSADEALRLGPAPARESYLDIGRIIDAARASGAAAVHPGYGFLAENAALASACRDAGLVFVGPPPEAIAAMGSKIHAKERVRTAGVPVLPDYSGPAQELADLERAGHALGLPLIVKPAAGGGGKGMQIVREAAALPAALAAARRLAASAFGDGTLLLERYLPAPRHVEVQVFADAHGAVVHLGDRDCSLQRRHQKLIEEAPAPDVPADVRARLHASALAVARAIGYVGAGTVEFLFDGRECYFMEMNTRLQVEHTVTEAVTGLDLVEWQLRVAAGEPLPLTQDQIRFCGHAIEARVCAEDPARAFLPSAGKLVLLDWPAAAAVRVDAGFAAGDLVPDCYDSLLGKVIASGSDRSEAIARLAAALESTRCAGVHVNAQWLARVLRSAAFGAVRHHVALLDEHGGDFAAAADPPAEALVLAALAVHGAPPVSEAAVSPWAACDGFTPNLPARVGLALLSGAVRHRVELRFAHGRAVSASLDDGAPLDLADVSTAPRTVSAAIAGRRRTAHVLVDGEEIWLWLGGESWIVRLDDPRTHEFSASAATGALTTPLPGVVASVAVSVGQAVAPGALLMVIEAMKMEHAVNAPYAGTVQALHFAPGDRVPGGAQLLELSRAEPDRT